METPTQHQPSVNMQAKKSLGQHFLTSSDIARAVVTAGGVQPGDVVLEIGPGTGILTTELLAQDARVIAIEKDADAIAILQERFAREQKEGKLTIVEGDIRACTPESLGISGAYKIVANIPYYITGEILRASLTQAHQPKSMALLVQKEVAERICRSPKESLLSLSVKVYGVPSYVRTVRAGSFNPPPKVDSAILAIANISRENFLDISESCFFSLIKKAFSEKRKQVQATLGALVGKENLFTALDELNINPQTRPEDIDSTLWLALAKKLQPFMHK